MQYIYVELIALLETVVYNFSWGTRDTEMKFAFLCSIPSNIKKAWERACMMYMQAYVSCKTTLFFIQTFYLEGQKAVVESLHFE